MKNKLKRLIGREVELVGPTHGNIRFCVQGMFKEYKERGNYFVAVGNSNANGIFFAPDDVREIESGEPAYGFMDVVFLK